MLTFYSLQLQKSVRPERIELANSYGKDEIVGTADLAQVVHPDEWVRLRTKLLASACKT